MPLLVRIRCVTIVVALGAPLWNSVRAQPLRAPDTITVRGTSLLLHGLLWRPMGHGPFPVVLFNHGSGPANDPRNPVKLAAAFVRHGYEFLYFYRRGAGLSRDAGTNSAQLMARAETKGGIEARNRVQLELLDVELGDVLAALCYLRARPDVDTARIAVAGHSFGGQLALLLAARDTGVRAVVAFAPAAASWEASPALRNRLIGAIEKIKMPVFFIHAANDYSVLPGEVLSAEMKRLGRPTRLVVYRAVGRTAADGHDFVHLSVTLWEPDVIAFLNDQLRAPIH